MNDPSVPFVTVVKKELTGEEDCFASISNEPPELDLSLVETSASASTDTGVISTKTTKRRASSNNGLKESLKPFYERGAWYMYCVGENGGVVKLPGLLLQAPRRKNRQILVFKTPSGSTKKFILCQHCEAHNSIVWVIYQNYVAQHIRRHHPECCDNCESCGQLIDRSLREVHSKVCRLKRSKIRPKRQMFLAIPGPNKQRNPSAEADELENCLKAAGKAIIQGCSDVAPGKPVMDVGEPPLRPITKEDYSAPELTYHHTGDCVTGIPVSSSMIASLRDEVPPGTVLHDESLLNMSATLPPVLMDCYPSNSPETNEIDTSNAFLDHIL